VTNKNAAHELDLNNAYIIVCIMWTACIIDTLCGHCEIPIELQSLMCSTNEEQPGNLKYHINDKGARQSS